MKKAVQVRRHEIQALRIRLERLEALQNEHGPKVAWATYQAETSEMRFRTLEQWVDTLQRAIAANPEAFREVALAALAAKVEPWP
jgi:hypothetical protein